MNIDYGTLAAIQRTRLNLSQEAVANRAGCHRATVMKFECGGSVQFEIVLRIMDAIGLKMEVVEADGR